MILEALFGSNSKGFSFNLEFEENPRANKTEWTEMVVRKAGQECLGRRCLYIMILALSVQNMVSNIGLVLNGRRLSPAKE